MTNLGLNRRSFLKGTSLSIATFVCGTVVNPAAGLTKASGFLEQKKVLDGISIESGSLPYGVKMVDTLKAEKAFLVGFKRLGNEYAKLLQFIDVQPDGAGFAFSGKVGSFKDTCTIWFQTSDLITCDFDYMNKVTNDVYAGVKFYFEMPYYERMAGRGGIDGVWDRTDIMNTLAESDLFDPRKKRG